MSHTLPTSGVRGVSVHWMARLLSIVISSVFLLVIGLAVTNEDMLQGAAIPLIALLALTTVANLAAWRWEKAGGLSVVLLALGLSAVAYSASQAFGLGSLSFLPALLYGAPFLVLGILFWVSDQITASGSHHDFTPPPPVIRRWWFIGAMLVIIVALTTIIVALTTGARPGGWLDTALNASGCLGILEEHESPVQSVAFSPDGTLLASGSQDGTARVWRVGEGGTSRWTLLHTLKISTGGGEAGHSQDVAFSPDGTTLAFGLPDGTVRLWRLSGNQRHPQAAPLHTLPAEAGRICSLGFSPDGRTLTAGAWDGSLHLWRVMDGTYLRSLTGHMAGVVSVAFSPDGTTLASASLDGTTKLWDISSGTLIHELQDPSVTTGVAFSPDGSMLVIGTGAGDRQLWSTDDWSVIRQLESAGGGMGNVVFSLDGTMIAAGNAWYEVCWWRVADGALLHTVRGHSDSVNSVTFSPDGKTLASGSLDGMVKLWRVIGTAAVP